MLNWKKDLQAMAGFRRNRRQISETMEEDEKNRWFSPSMGGRKLAEQDAEA